MLVLIYKDNLDHLLILSIENLYLCIVIETDKYIRR